MDQTKLEAAGISLRADGRMVEGRLDCRFI